MIPQQKSKRVRTFDDYLAIVSRRLWLIAIPIITMPFLGVGVSFLMAPRYTSKSVLQVEPQLVPSLYVHPIVTEHLNDRINVLEQRVLSRDHLEPLISRLGLVEKGRNPEAIMEEIRANVSVAPAYPGSSSSQASQARKQLASETKDPPGYSVSFTAGKPHEAQLVCEEITSMLLAENLKRRAQAAETTTDFLTRRLEDARLNLDLLDKKLAEFEKEHLGRLPIDADYNLKILSGLNSQLDANTQVLGRAQQDKSFAESLLSQETDAWKAVRISPNLASLREQLVQQRNQLVILQSRYTDDHPDVQKAKQDIAQAEHELQGLEQKADATESAPSDPEKVEPEPILRLRRQVHDDETVIARSLDELSHLKASIDSYQAKLALSPDVEEQYKQLTRDNETARAVYEGLLQDESKAEIQSEMEHEQQGEQLKLLDGANFPNAPSFPVRWMFAVGGFAVGLSVGIGVALFVEVRDKSLRNASDVAAVLDLPMLASLPWVPHGEQKRNGRGRLLGRFRPLSAQ